MRLIPFDIDGHKRELEKQIKPLADHVLSGKCATLEEYKAKTGEIRGLRAATEAINATLKRTNEDDDG